MDITDDELEDLPDDPELAFVEFERKLSAIANLNQGSRDWGAERKYAIGIIAFVHEMEIDIAVPDKLPPADDDFYLWFDSFKQKIDYYLNRMRIRRRKSLTDQYIPILELTSDFRAEIHTRLDQIRRIVRAGDWDEDKRDAIFDKISAVAKEVDKSKTRLGAFLSLYLDVTDAIGKGKKISGRFVISSTG